MRMVKVKYLRILIVATILSLVFACKSFYSDRSNGNYSVQKDCLSQENISNSMLFSYVGPLEFNDVNIINSIEILKENLKENKIYLSIVFFPEGVDCSNTFINIKIKRCTLKDTLDQFCTYWNGAWEIRNNNGPIYLKAKAEGSKYSSGMENNE